MNSLTKKRKIGEIETNDEFNKIFNYIYTSEPIEWKNTLSYITYKRTYARRKNPEDVKSITEDFKDTMFRLITSFNTQLGMNLTYEEQCEYYNIMSSFKALPAGRFLWQLGTETVNKYGLLSLQNCAFTEINNYESFCWAFDCLMLGSGVGFNIQREYVYKLSKPYKVICNRSDTSDADFIVPDSREGWVAILRYTLRAHFEKVSCQSKSFTFSCQCLRSKGASIKGFGGTASGPDHLCEGIKDINTIINNRAESNESLRPIDCLDIMNIIARTVISGNVRRSALICLGDYDDMEYLKAKRWDLGIPNWRCHSNNSVVCDDIKKLPEEFWEGYKGNGEPYGLINIKNARRMGRTGEVQYPDHKVSGFNPSMRKGTRVMTSEGVKEIQQLQNKFFKIKNIDGKWSRARCWLSGNNKPLYKLTLANGYEYFSTKEHKWPIKNNSLLSIDTDESTPTDPVSNISQEELDGLKIEETLGETSNNNGLTRTTTNNIKPGNKLPMISSQNWGNTSNVVLTYTDGYCLGLLYSSPVQFIRNSFENNDEHDTYIWCLPKTTKFAHTILTTWLTEIDHAVIRVIEQKSETGVDFNIYTTQGKTFTNYMKKFGLPTALKVEDKSYGLPNVIWSSMDEFRHGFIDAMYSISGNFQEQSGLCYITNKSETVIRDIWDIFGFYGINSTIKLKNKQVPCMVIFEAVKFSNLFHCTNDDKQGKLNTIKCLDITTDEMMVVNCELTDLKEDVWDVTVFDNDHMFQ
jgi:hypothetical protein